jgi:hypothetical protein
MTRPDEPDDEDLRRAFTALRREDAAHAPGLERLLARPQPSRHRTPVRLAGFMAAAAAAGVAAMILAQVFHLFRRPAPDGVVAPTVASWSAPTDFLLRTPGQDILGPLPRLGGGSALSPLSESAARTPAPHPRSVAP